MTVRSRLRASVRDVPAPRAGDEDPHVASADAAAERPDVPSVVPPSMSEPDVGVVRTRSLRGLTSRGQFSRGLGDLTLNLSKRYSLVILLAISFVFYSTWSTTSSVFLTSANMRIMTANQAVNGVLTLGILVTMVAGNFDLSVGNIAGLSQIMTASLYAHHGFGLIPGVLAGVAIGAFVGGINGVLVTVLRVDPFIITLGTASAILGFIDWYTNDQSIVNGIPSGLIDFGRNDFLGVPDIVWVTILVALAVWYLLEHTPYGRNLHAIGSNRAAARLVGIRVERSIAMAFVINGFFAGVAGVLMLAHAGAGNPQIPPTLALTALAGAFLGAASFKVGRLNVPGTIVALLFLTVNITGLTFAGVANWINEMFTGLSLIFAIALAAVLSKERKAKRSPSEPIEKTRTTA